MTPEKSARNQSESRETSEFLDPIALAEALRFLAKRARFESEVREHLASKEMETDPIIGHLRRRRIIDDGKLIQNLIECHAGKRAIGKEKLRAELIRRGAPEEEVDLALANLGEPENALDRLLADKLRPGDSRAKAGRFLASRGFEEEQIESALDRFFGTD